MMLSSFPVCCLPSHLMGDCLVSSGLYQYGLHMMQHFVVSYSENNPHILHQQPPTAIPSPPQQQSICVSVERLKCFLYK